MHNKVLLIMLIVNCVDNRKKSIIIIINIVNFYNLY